MTTGSAPDITRRAYVVPGFILLGAIWGSSFLFIKVAIDELHPLYVTLGRVLLGAVTLLIVLALVRIRLPSNPRVWAHLAVLGTIGVALPFTLFAYGEQRIPSLLAGIWNATTPLAALPLAALLFRTERLTARKVTGIAVGFLGVLVVLGVWQGVGGAALTGQLMCLGAAVCYGFAIAYMRRFLAAEPITGLALAAGQVIAATIVLALVAPVVAGPPPALTSLSAEVIGSMLALGALGTGLAFVIHMRNIRLVGASTASLVTYLVPLFAVVAGVLVLSETLRWYQPAGAVVVLIGVAISQGFRGRWRRRPRVTDPLTTAGQPSAMPAPAAEPSARRSTPAAGQPTTN